MSALAEIELGLCDCETCRLLEALEPQLTKYRDALERRQTWFILKCCLIAGDLETCEALLRGERVPKSRLDPKWAKAYGY